MNPKEITFDPELDAHIASFDYYTGIAYAKHHNLKQTTQFHDVMNNTHFMVCCGDVIV